MKLGPGLFEDSVDCTLVLRHGQGSRRIEVTHLKSYKMYTKVFSVYDYELSIKVARRKRLAHCASFHPVWNAVLLDHRQHYDAGRLRRAVDALCGFHVVRGMSFPDLSAIGRNVEGVRPRGSGAGDRIHACAGAGFEQMASTTGRGLLLHEVKRASAAYDAETCVLGACAFCLFELGFDVVAVFLTLVGEDSAGVIPGGDDAVCR